MKVLYNWIDMTKTPLITFVQNIVQFEFALKDSLFPAYYILKDSKSLD